MTARNPAPLWAAARAGVIAAGVFAAACATAVHAGDLSCPAKLYRFEEDCRTLAPIESQLTGFDRLRYISFNDGRDWLTLGGEFRAKLESFDAPNAGIGPISQRFTAWSERWYMHADLHDDSGWRAFVQLSAAADDGRKPMERSFDRSAPDLAQGFIDIPLPSTVLRIGRRELDLGGNRLVSTRDPANLRRAFDMVHTETRLGKLDVMAFFGAPVVNRPEAFDDRADPSERFYGANVRVQDVGRSPADTLDFYVLARDCDKAVYQDATGRDARRAVGSRFAGKITDWDYAIQGTYQFGSVGPSIVSAFGIAGDVGYTATMLPLSPRFGVSFGRASGDTTPGDGKLNSYDPLYPNLSYLTDAPVVYAINTTDAEPNVTLHLTKALSLRLGSDFVFRTSRNDAVYAPNGLPLIQGTGRGTSFLGALSYAKAIWQATDRVSVEGSFVRGSIGDTIAKSGGRDITYGYLQIAFRF